MAKNIVNQLNEMQDELKELKAYKKTVQSCIKKLTAIENEKCSGNDSEFEKKICEFLDLKNDTEKQEYLSMVLTEHHRNFWQQRRKSRSDDSSFQSNY